MVRARAGQEVALPSVLGGALAAAMPDAASPPASRGPLRRRTSGIGEAGEAPAWHGLAAGCFAGASGVLIGHGFDTLKVQAQVGQKTSSASLLQLYRGILPPLLTTGAMRSVYFGVYEFTRPSVAHALGRPSTDLG